VTSDPQHASLSLSFAVSPTSLSSPSSTLLLFLFSLFHPSFYFLCSFLPSDRLLIEYYFTFSPFVGLLLVDFHDNTLRLSPFLFISFRIFLAQWSSGMCISLCPVNLIALCVCVCVCVCVYHHCEDIVTFWLVLASSKAKWRILIWF